MSAHRAVCAAVRDWQAGTGSADDVAAMALAEAGGDEDQASGLMRAAVEWWQRLGTFRDVNGAPITRRAA